MNGWEEMNKILKLFFPKENFNMGQFVKVMIDRSTTTSLIGRGISLVKNEFN